MSYHPGMLVGLVSKGKCFVGWSCPYHSAECSANRMRNVGPLWDIKHQQETHTCCLTASPSSQKWAVEVNCRYRYLAAHFVKADYGPSQCPLPIENQPNPMGLLNSMYIRYLVVRISLRVLHTPWELKNQWATTAGQLSARLRYSVSVGIHPVTFG